MRTVNPLLTRLVAKKLKPRNTVVAALNNRSGGGGSGAGAHRKSRGALRRAENMALAHEIANARKGGNEDA